jgi:hypothetical protein
VERKIDDVGFDLIYVDINIKMTVSIPEQVFAVFFKLLDIYYVYHTRILHFHAVCPFSTYDLSYYI